MTKLLADVRVVTGNINSTLVSVTEETKGDIIAEINVSVGHITSLVNGVVAELEGKVRTHSETFVSRPASRFSYAGWERGQPRAHVV